MRIRLRIIEGIGEEHLLDRLGRGRCRSGARQILGECLADETPERKLPGPSGFCGASVKIRGQQELGAACV
jgi:hypothetical protein